MATQSVSGRFMDGRSAVDRAVEVRVEPGHLALFDETGLVSRFPLSGVRVDAMSEGVVHVESEAMPGALLSVEDPTFPDFLRSAGVEPGRSLGGRRGIAIGIACLVVFAGLMGGLHLAMPKISEAIARRVPVSVERDLAKGMGSMLSERTCRTEGATAAIGKLRDRLDPERHEQVDIQIVNLPLVNAFALPGNVVLLTRGLLEEAKSADEIAGVLAHELAHVEHRHALSHMIRKTLLAALWIATVGDYSGLLVVDPKTAYEMATLQYSRDAETEADETGLRMLTDHHISSKGLAEFLQRVTKDQGDGVAWLSTHPASEDRVAHLLGQKLKGPPEPALDDDSLYELRKACESAKAMQSARELFF